jgi:acyl carrier protein
MPHRTTQDRLFEIIHDQLDVSPESLTLNSKFVEDLGAESVDAVELAMAFEEEFNINIPDEHVEGLRTVGDVLRYIENRAGVPEE